MSNQNSKATAQARATPPAPRATGPGGYIDFEIGKQTRLESDEYRGHGGLYIVQNGRRQRVAAIPATHQEPHHE